MQKISELHEHFTSISGSVTKDGVIDKNEFRKALGMKDSLFVDRVFTLFDKNGDGAPSVAVLCLFSLSPSRLVRRHHQLQGVPDGPLRVLPLCQLRGEAEVFVRHLRQEQGRVY
jgi:hypothetical protein